MAYTTLFLILEVIVVILAVGTIVYVGSTIMRLSKQQPVLEATDASGQSETWCAGE